MRIKNINGPTWVYYLMCEHEGLLYVGIASDLDRRLTQHRATKSWWPEVCSVSSFRAETRDIARTVEAHVITTQHPRHNVQGRVRHSSGHTAEIRYFDVVAGRLSEVYR